jgi:raffinose/stachyose/melibiose transport system permease protein
MTSAEQSLRTENRLAAAQSAPRRSLRFGSRVLTNGLLLVYALTAIFPIIWMGYSSLKTREEFARDVFSLPSAISFEAYVKIIGEGFFFRALFNSIFASTIAISLIVVISFPVAYALARYQFPGRRIVYLFFLFGLMVPIYALLVPVFLQFKTIGMLDNQFTIIAPLVAFEMSGAIFLIESYIRAIPTEIEEAAFIDGAGVNYILARIVFPMCAPILVTILILDFLWTWNAFAFPLILLRSTELKTIPLWLNTFHGERSTDYPTLMGALVLASIPVILVYLIFREKIMQGMVAGATKG